MNKLIKMVTIVASVGAMLNFAGCDNSTPSQQVVNKPEEVVLKVLKTLQNGKSDAAFYSNLNKYCTEHAAGVFLLLNEVLSESYKDVKCSVISTSITSTSGNDVAAVKIRMENLKTKGGVLETKDEVYALKNIGGQWKLECERETELGDLCISKKTVTVCVEAFKAAVLKNDDWKCKERFTNECWDELQGEMGKASAEALARLQEAVRELKIESYDPAVEIECKMPGNSDGRLILKMHDGKWKIAKID